MKVPATCLAATLLIAGASSAQTLYAIGNGQNDAHSDLYRIDQHDSTPMAIAVGCTDVLIGDIAIHPDTGLLYGLQFVSGGTALVQIDPENAAVVALIGENMNSLNALEFADDGELYAWGLNDHFLHTIDLDTGLATSTGIDMQANSGGDLAFCRTDGFLYGTTGEELIRVDLGASSAVIVGSHVNGSMIFGLEADASGNLFGFEGDDADDTAIVYDIDKATGITTLVGTIAGADDIGLFGVSFACDGAAQVVTSLRNGTGVNPVGLTELVAPTIGHSWDFAVDIATPGAIASIVIVGTGGPTNGFVFTSGLVAGELLCLPPFVRIDVAFGTHSIPLRSDCNLLGANVCAQGATFSPGVIQLNNAIDATVGYFR